MVFSPISRPSPRHRGANPGLLEGSIVDFDPAASIESDIEMVRTREAGPAERRRQCRLRQCRLNCRHGLFRVRVVDFSTQREHLPTIEKAELDRGAELESFESFDKGSSPTSLDVD